MSSTTTVTTTTTAALQIRVHHLPVRSKFRGTTDIDLGFQSRITAQSRKRLRDNGDHEEDEDEEVAPSARERRTEVKSDEETRRTELSHLDVHFRGRKLVGTVVEIVSGRQSSRFDGEVGGGEQIQQPSTTTTISSSYTGAVLLIPTADEKDIRSSSSLTRTVSVWSTFSSYVAWEHDTAPSSFDTTNVLLWLSLAKDIHHAGGD